MARMPLTSPALSGPRRLLPAVAVAGATLWFALLVGAPYAVSHGHPDQPIFRAGGIVYMAGRLLCHQRAERSFHLWGTQLPVCARCTGLYAGAVLGALVGAVAGRRERQWSGHHLAFWRAMLLSAAAPTAISVGLERLNVWGQTPTLRAVIAVPLGFAVAWFVTAAAHADQRPTTTLR